MTSESYLAWKERIFGAGYMIWHDGLNTDAVTRLVGQERELALGMLRVGLDAGDMHAAQALAAMRDVQSRQPVLTQLSSASGSAKVAFALAAHELAPDPALAQPLVEVLQGLGPWSERIGAAIGLRRFAGAADESALLRAVGEDADYLVRYHASESLLHRWNVRPPAISKHTVVFELIRGPDRGQPSKRDFSRFEEACRRLLTLRAG